MQAIVQVICRKGPSLRESIVNDDKRLDVFGLKVSGKLKSGRQKGWAKIHSTRSDRWGALNIEWDSDTCILLCRVVNRRKGSPELALGDFVAYLLRHYRRRITIINIVPPE
jgi:hypothetical protein